MSTAAADNSNFSQGLSVDDMRALLQSVTDTTEQLQATHNILHDQVARLQAELTEANNQLRRSKQLAALGEMAAGIAHELRNPLGSIQLYVQMLAEDLADNKQDVELCQKISQAVTGLDAIVRDVLMFARDTVLRPQLINGEELFDSALSSCASLLQDRNVTVERHFEHKLYVFGDATLLSQALTNLIRNAIEAASDSSIEQPRLILETRQMMIRCPSGNRQNRLIFAVEDNGSGVSDDVLKRMFNPFFTTRATGTGLGLAIVHRIIDAHDGHINVRSTDHGGARFEVCLPPSSSGVTPPTVAPPIIEIKVDSIAVTRRHISQQSGAVKRNKKSQHHVAVVSKQTEHVRSHT